MVYLLGAPLPRIGMKHFAPDGACICEFSFCYKHYALTGLVLGALGILVIVFILLLLRYGRI